MKQSGKTRIFIIVVSTLIFLGVILLLWISHIDHQNRMDIDSEVVPSVRGTEGVEKTPVKLYFGLEGDIWQIEEREMDLVAPQQEGRIRLVVEELLKGPQTLDNTAIPDGTRLLSLFVDKDGTAYLDLSEEVRINHPGGTWSELLTIYSLVNTVEENFPDINGVKILVMGKEIETLKGHIDTRNPFSFKKKL